KRASPGAEVSKNGTSADIELSEADALKLTELSREMAAAELVLERRAQMYLEPFFLRRRAVLQSIPKFWPQALNNMGGTALHLQHQQDQDALSFLHDIWVVRDTTEPRCFTLEFHFKPNPYFSDEVLTKEYKYLATPTPDETPVADGITNSMLLFNWEQNVAPQKIIINWKDDPKHLTKLYPRVSGEDSDDMPAEPGSFFNYFEYADDPFDIGMAIATDLFPEAIDYFTGTAGDGLEFDDDSEDDEDEDDEEIDLEKPRKKQK
ncbi:hypothetical protein K439DRAFT_1288688, partial [Ramaria rubella]